MIEPVIDPIQEIYLEYVDRDSYRVGSTALLTIKSSKPNLYAIFTLERV